MFLFKTKKEPEKKNKDLQVNVDLEIITKMNQEFAISLDLNETLKTALQVIIARINAQAANIFLINEKKALTIVNNLSTRENVLEIGPGNGMFSKEFRSWRKNFFLDVLQSIERKIRRRFNPGGQKHLTFYTTRDHECSNIPQGSCSFIFSWDTFVFFTQNHIQHYLNSIKRILVPGGYVFLQYADCHYDYDLHQAKRGYWNYNTKSAMEKMIKEEGYEVIEMRQFCTGANYVIFKKPGKNNPFTYKVSEITLD